MTIKNKIIEILEKFFQNPIEVDKLYYEGKTSSKIYDVHQFLEKYVSYFGNHLAVSDNIFYKYEEPDCIYVINWIKRILIEKIPFTRSYQYSLRKYRNAHEIKELDDYVPKIRELSNIFRVSGFSSELQNNILDDISDYFTSDIVHISIFNIMYSDFLGSIPIYYLGEVGEKNGPIDRELFRSIQDLKNYYESRFNLETSGYLIYQTYVKL